MQNTLMPGLFTHETNGVAFVLRVDDFLVKYTAGELYTILVYKDAKIYVGIKLDWDWSKRTCTLRIPGYIKAVIHNFNHPQPKKTQDSPHKCKGKYGDGQKPLPTPTSQK